MDQFLQFIGACTCILFVLWLLARAIWGKNWGVHLSLTYFLGWGLKGALSNLLGELEKGTVTKETTADVVSNVFWRLTMIGAIGLLIAILPSWLLMQQNGLLKKQNEKIDFQVNLEEATRRSSLVFLMANVEDRIAEELKDNKARELSPELIGRIAALSQSLKPYRYWDGDSLTDKRVSPERAQLFLSLLRSELSDSTYKKIFISSDFRNADLKRSQLNQINAYKADLRGANLSEANLNKANLRRANLHHADLPKANLNEAILSGAIFQGADLRGADLHGADLHRANLSEVDLRGADLREANLSEADLQGADLSGANLSWAKLNRAFLYKANLNEAFLSETCLDETNLRMANLSGVRNFNYESLYLTKSLYKTIGIPDSILLHLLKEKPELLKDIYPSR